MFALAFVFHTHSGMEEEASRELMQSIMDIATAEPYQHGWRKGDYVYVD